MTIFLYVLVATILEAMGDAVVRMALHKHHSALLARVGLYLVGGVLLTLYGTSLNLAPIEFAAVTGMYAPLLVPAT